MATLAEDQTRARWPLPALVVGLGIPLLLARGSLPSLAYDESIFFEGSGAGLAGLVEPYAGYLHLVPRTAALAAATVDAWWLPWAVSLVAALWVASFYSSGRFASLLPLPWQRLAAGLAVLVLPGTIQTLGLVAGVQWYGALYLVGWLAASPPVGRLASVVDRLALVLFALSGPFSMLLAPLYVWHARRGLTPAHVVVVAGGLIQLASLLIVGRDGPTHFGDPGFVQVLGFRGIAGPVLGTMPSHALANAGFAFGIGVAAVAALAALLVAVVLGQRVLWPQLAVGAAIVFLGAGTAGESTAVLLNGAGARYLLVLGLGLVLACLRGLALPDWRQRLPAIALTAIVGVGIVGDFRVPVRAFYGWPYEI